jgi:hypothetical protein
MDEKKFKDFLVDPEGLVSDWIETTMNRSGASYSKVSRFLGINRDALYKFANREALAHNIQMFRAVLLMAETEDLTMLAEMASIFNLELVTKGAIAMLKSLPDAVQGIMPDDRYPLYQKHPRRPLLKAMMEEASEKA